MAITQDNRENEQELARAYEIKQETNVGASLV